MAIGLDSGTSVGNATRLETYREAHGLTSADGALGDLDGGTVRLELWNVLGAGTTDVGLTGSVLLPYG